MLWTAYCKTCKKAVIRDPQAGQVEEWARMHVLWTYHAVDIGIESESGADPVIIPLREITIEDMAPLMYWPHRWPAKTTGAIDFDYEADEEWPWDYIVRAFEDYS